MCAIEDLLKYWVNFKAGVREIEEFAEVLGDF